MRRSIRNIFSLVLVFLMLITGYNFTPLGVHEKKVFASSSNGVVYPNATVTGVGYSGYYDVYDAGSSIAENIVITGIKYKATMTSYGSVGSLILCSYHYENAGFYDDGLQMPLPTSMWSTQNYSITFDPSQSAGLKRIAVRAPFWSGGGAQFNITITEIDYIVYNWDNISTQISQDRHVQIVLNSSVPMPNVYLKAYNETTGNTLYISGQTGTQFVFDDKNVNPEHYYTYDLYWEIGWATDINYSLRTPYPWVYIGTYTIKVPSDATLAYQAATAAQQAAQQAQASADQVNSIVNSTLTVSAGVVQDSSGTVLTAARAAQQAAQQANTGIQNLSNQMGNLQNTLNTVNNSINNIQTLLPPTLKKISGYNGATATSSTLFKVTLDYTNATDYRVAVDGNWSGWNSLSSYQTTGYIPVTLPSSPGMHQITVQIRNGSGSTAPTDQASMSVFKL
ncbi:hypothetical protein DNHGIG_32310 [Collibacillus ludicampi]|uniref:Uncharacterized protein n=1 Tax=Collibacillus ludicampi TaxID=2771369 RepID=A0AAV4LJY8_9BACL|nr:hypothetical protein [Collibacillus ludicampi]GIM47682.1 hypothetical protein DNHGIG_32310 [Collibacillus ludicampi]